jgi:hypothetical protein
VPNRQVILVQGGKKNEAVYPWMFFHFDPTTGVDPGTVDLVFFDYPAGKLKTWKSWDKKRGRAPTAQPDSEEELTPKLHYRKDDGELDTGPERASVIALYDYVKKQPKGSIRSLQVFSHGVIGGPILWNSYEFGPDGEDLDSVVLPRDPNDVDFRVRDFFGSNPLSGDEGTKFAQAFTTDALIKLWGCVAPSGVRGHIRGYFAAPKGTAGDAKRQAHLKLYNELIGGSFAMQMALALHLSVWAAPLGYGTLQGTVVPTDYTDGAVSDSLNVKYKGEFPPDLKKDQWWRVSWFFRNQDRGAEFYRDVLKARLDATDYVEHKQLWFDDAEKRATASLEPNPVATPADLQQRLVDKIPTIGQGASEAVG